MTTCDRWKTKSKINSRVQIGKVVQDTEDSANESINEMKYQYENDMRLVG